MGMGRQSAFRLRLLSKATAYRHSRDLEIPIGTFLGVEGYQRLQLTDLHIVGSFPVRWQLEGSRRSRGKRTINEDMNRHNG